MKERINLASVNPGAIKALLGVEKYLFHCGLDRKLLDLIYLRVSQVNGCAYCIDMHWKDLRHMGESEQRLYGLDAWRESSLYSEPERAALAWAEAVTTLPNREVPEPVFEEAHRHFNDEQLANLTLAIATINSWNRLNIAFKREPGSYKAGYLEKMLAAS
jgi:AhpD family alkylhydroperoxidase